MTWTPLPLGGPPDVLVTVAKKKVTLIVSGHAVRRLGWTEDEPNASFSLGEGDHTGWLRIAMDEEGISLEADSTGALVIAMPRSTLPDLQDCRLAPLTWKPSEAGAIEIRLPTVAARAQRPQLAVVGSRQTAVGNPSDDAAVADTNEANGVIAPPALYRQLHRNAWQAGVELTFFADGSAMVAGRHVSDEEIESVVMSEIKRRA